MTIDQIGQMMFLMLAAHAYADFALQNPWHSAAKYPNNDTGIPWQVGLTYHGAIHGGLVAVITGHWFLGVAETIAHAAIDLGKSYKFYGAKTDQVAHIACKIIWCFIAFSV